MTNSNEQLVPIEQCVIVCPQCEGEGSYADGLDEAACSTDCTRCGTNGWIVDLAALRTPPAVEPDEGLVVDMHSRAITFLGQVGHEDWSLDWLIANAMASVAPSIRAQALEDDLKPIGYISWLAGLHLDATDPEAITATDITDFDREAGFMSTPIYVKRSALKGGQGV